MRPAVVAALLAGPATAQDVWVLGEVHDNPAHHAKQAEMVADIAPAALVFEMLTPDQASRITPDLRGDPAALAREIEWDSSGWPAFSMYYPIIAAAPEAELQGAGVPRGAARMAMEKGIADTFGAGAADYGLTAPLPEDQQALREALQADAHCGALPPEMLPAMVGIQRLRDAVIARAARDAARDVGTPVVVVTGNGHARTDWGMPALLAQAAPTLEVRSIGQGEDGVPPAGSFDVTFDAPAAARPDPCAVFD